MKLAVGGIIFVMIYIFKLFKFVTKNSIMEGQYKILLICPIAIMESQIDSWPLKTTVYLLYC